MKSPKNPARPFDSPIKVQHAGGWADEFKHEIANPKPATKPIPNRIKYHRGFDEFQESKTESAQIDAALEKAIREDHVKRNLRPKKNND